MQSKYGCGHWKLSLHLALPAVVQIFQTLSYYLPSNEQHIKRAQTYAYLDVLVLQLLSV